MQVLTTPLPEEAPVSETASECPIPAVSSSVNQLQPVSIQSADSEVSEAVQAIERCFSVQEFLEVGQRHFQGKAEQF